MPHYLRTILPLAAVLAIPVYNEAQTVTATLTGVVTDSTGAILPSTTVELTNPATGVSFTVKTTSAGSYRFGDIPPGPNYVLTFTHDGFVSVSVKGLYVNVANVRTENVQLKAGNNIEVEVLASGRNATINTEDASVGINYQVEKLDELPIQDRTSVFRLFQLQPGVTSGGSTTGSRTDQNNTTVDGLDVNDFATGSFGNINGGASVDSVQEFRATVGGFGVGSGPGGGGQFNLVTRSGTNSFHGNLNEYHRDRSTVANDWFNKLAGVARPQLIRNQFGGSLGGPILHDKLFFFVDVNYWRQAASSPVHRIVPLNSFRAGNVSYINNGGECSKTSRQNSQSSCISFLSPDQVKAMDPAGLGNDAALLSFVNAAYPQANDVTGGDGINTGYYRFNANNQDDRSQYASSLDYTLTPNIKFRGVGNFTRQDRVQTLQQFPSSPALTAPFSDRSYRWAGSMFWQIGSTKFNQFTVGRVVQDFAFPVDYNPQGVNPLSFNSGTTTLLDDPFKSPSNAQSRRIPILQFNDDFNWQIGRHTLTLGGSFKYITTSSNTKLDYATLGIGVGGENAGLNASLRPGNLLQGSSTATVTYDSAYAAMLGRIASVSGNYNYNAAGQALPLATGSQRNYKYYQTLAYAGDTWKVTPSLTLDYGVNYQFFSVPYEVNGLETVQTVGFNDYFGARVAQSAAGRSGIASVPLLSYVLGGKANNGPDLFHPDWKNLAPRFAFAYNPSFDRATVFRGSIGLVFDRTVVNAVQYQQDQSSYLFQQPLAISNGVSGDPRTALQNDPRYSGAAVVPTPPPTPKSGFQPFVNNGVPYGLQNGQAFNTTIDPNLKTPYNILTNFTVEHSFQEKTILRFSYVGRLGRRLLGQTDSNQLIDFADPASGQTMGQAMSNVVMQARAHTAITAQPWFENQVKGYKTAGYSSTTAAIVDQDGSLIPNGDFADTIQSLSPYLQANVGMGAQFSFNNYYTNRGFSSYNALLISLQQNMTHGLQFDANYTWQHSIDNVSLIANTNGSGGTGLICDALRPRLCRSSSDFDETHLFNANFTYQLPFGRGRQFGGNLPKALNEVVGGWDISGIPSWHSGLPFTPTGEAFVASYSNDAPVLFNGDVSAIQKHVHKVAGQLSMFDNPEAAVNAFQGPIGFNIGSRNFLRGPKAFEFDAGVAKSFALYKDSVNLKFRADAFNALNHPVFSTPTTGGTNSDIVNASQFGQLTSTTGNQPYRVLQLALRLEF